MSVLSWGEQPRGTWVLDIIDEVTGDTTGRPFPYEETYLKSCLISGFPHGANQIFALLGMLRGVDWLLLLLLDCLKPSSWER